MFNIKTLPHPFRSSRELVEGEKYLSAKLYFKENKKQLNVEMTMLLRDGITPLSGQ